MTYRVKTVCRLTGINRSTLLAWERRYNVVEPIRGDNGYRAYTEEHVERLKQLKHLVDAGHAVSEALEMLGGGDLNSALGELFERLMAYDINGATNIADSVDNEAIEDQLSLLYMPLIREVGEAWARGETSVAQEHFATGFIRGRLQSLLVRARQSGVTRPLAALMTPIGEKHELGLIAVAIRLCDSGWAVDLLGRELPMTELPDYCNHKQPDLVCVSLVRKREAEEVERLARSIREIVPAKVPIAIGGRATVGLAARVEGVHFLTDPRTLQELVS